MVKQFNGEISDEVLSGIYGNTAGQCCPKLPKPPCPVAFLRVGRSHVTKMGVLNVIKAILNVFQPRLVNSVQNRTENCPNMVTVSSVSFTFAAENQKIFITTNLYSL